MASNLVGTTGLTAANGPRRRRRPIDGLPALRRELDDAWSEVEALAEQVEALTRQIDGPSFRRLAPVIPFRPRRDPNG